MVVCVGDNEQKEHCFVLLVFIDLVSRLRGMVDTYNTITATFLW